MNDRAVIKVGQLNEDGSALNEIGAWVIDVSTWGRIRRVFTDHVEEDTPGAIWIELADMDGVLTDERISITASAGQWFLRDWFKPPQREWKKIGLSL